MAQFMLLYYIFYLDFTHLYSKVRYLFKNITVEFKIRK